MEFFKKLSIKNKFISVIVIVTLISAGLGIILSSLKQYSDLKKDLIHESKLSSELIGEYSVSALVFNDASGAKEALANIKLVPFISYAAIYDTSGNLFASYSNTKLVAIHELPSTEQIDLLPKHFSTKSAVVMLEDYILVTSPIRYKGIPYGTIVIKSSMSILRSKISDFITIDIIRMILILFIAYFLASVLQGFITKPILNLANITREVSAKDDYSIRVHSDYKDEIGTLYIGFNNMMEQIHRRQLERDKSEKALRESELKHRTLFETMTEGVVYHNRDGEIISVNTAAEEILGITLDEILGSTSLSYDWITIHEDGSVFPGEEHPAMVSLKTGEQVRNKLMGIYNKRDNRYRWIKINSVPQFIPGENAPYIVYTTFSDFTDIKIAEEKLSRLNYELIEKNKELEQIIYVTSHDLRSPLVNIQGFSNELEYLIQELFEIISNGVELEEIKLKADLTYKNEINTSLHYIATSILKMDTLLKGLLRLSRLGRSAIIYKKINMNKFITDILNSFEYFIKDSGINIVTSDLEPCYGDEDLLSQVFSNLIGNAIKFHDNKRKAKIIITSFKDGTNIVYCVEDNGIGIKEEYQDKIFEIFHRLHPETTSGEGLGLTIVKKIIERHEGKVWVESEPGRGSKFFVSLTSILPTRNK